MPSGRSIEPLMKLFSTLHADVKFSVEQLNREPKNFGFWARSYVHTYAAWIEGNVWLYKELVSKSEEAWHRELDFPSQMYLFGYDWKVASNGEPKIAPKRIATVDNLKAALKVFPKLLLSKPIDLSGPEWDSVKSFYISRDAIAHPKKGEDLELVKDDILKFEIGRKWLRDIFIDFNSGIVNRLDREEG